MVTKVSKTPNMKCLNGLTATGFLLMITQKYGYTIEKVGYIHIALYLSSRGKEWISPISVRAYFFKLEELGYIQIDNKGRRDIRFTLIKDKVNKLLGINEQQQKNKNYIPLNTDNGFCMVPPAHYDVFLKTFNNNKEKILFSLFWYLYIHYNSESRRQNKVCPFFVSMDVLAKNFNTQRKYISKALKTLEDHKFISRTQDRKGRAKYGYIVNNQLLNELAENIQNC